MRGMLAWKHVPYGQLVVFIVIPAVVYKKVEQADYDSVPFNALYPGTQLDDRFLEDCGMGVNALVMMLGPTVREDEDYTYGRLLFDRMVENDITEYR